MILPSCTFLTHKQQTQKHTPGIPLYSRRPIVILIVAIWRKRRYTWLNLAGSWMLKGVGAGWQILTLHTTWSRDIDTVLTALLSFLPLCEEATTARYWMTFLVFSVFPAPDSPLEKDTREEIKWCRGAKVSDGRFFDCSSMNQWNWKETDNDWQSSILTNFKVKVQHFDKCD